MAMYERRSSMESFERRRRGSDQLQRKLSFSPVGGEWEGITGEQQAQVPIGAFEVGKTKRILQVFVAVIYCLFAAGVVFGFAAIKPVLIDQGVYQDLCTKEELDGGVYVCYAQELRLNLMFAIAAVSTNVCALPVGTILDRYGPRVASLVGVGFITLGALFLAFAADAPFDAWIPGYLFLALGGPFVFISSFQLSNTFPKNSGLILALLTGAFDTSSAVFLAYRLIYQSSNGTFTPKKFFLVYLVVPAFILLAQIFVQPAQSYKSVGELITQAEESVQDPPATRNGVPEGRSASDAERQRRESVVSEITALLGSKGGDEQQKEEEQKAERSGVWGALHGKTAGQQILTPWFILITLFTVVQMTRINYFVATLRTQYVQLLHSVDKAVTVNEFFDVALPLGGIVAIPFIGGVLDHTPTPFALGLLVTVATAIGILGVIPTMWAAYSNVVLFVLYRPLYYTAVSDYSAKVFGFATFGKVYGLIICLAGLGNFSQTGLDALTHKQFGNDPVPVNVGLLTVAFVVGVALVAYVSRKSYTMHREKLEEEAEEARETLMPAADEEQVERPHGHEGYGSA